MAAGQFIGGNLGARATFKFGPKLVRKVVVLVVIALVTKLSHDIYISSTK
jgi:uncharacterized protein